MPTSCLDRFGAADWHPRVKRGLGVFEFPQLLVIDEGSSLSGTPLSAAEVSFRECV